MGFDRGRKGDRGGRGRDKRDGFFGEENFGDSVGFQERGGFGGGGRGGYGGGGGG
jgi:CspA family cold shock protein